MDADLSIDDGFQLGQTDSRMRQSAKAKAWSGVPTFIMILTGISGMVPVSVLSMVKFSEILGGGVRPDREGGLNLTADQSVVGLPDVRLQIGGGRVA